MRVIATAAVTIGMLASACSRTPAAFGPLNDRTHCEGSQGYAAALGGRRTFSWRPEWLHELKRDWTQHPEHYAQLFEMADQALSVQPYTVTGKGTVLPDVPPHDYASLATYWWPNGASPSGLPYIRRDGFANPARLADRFDLVRLESMARDVQILALAFYLTGEERYAGKAAELLRVWFLNPSTRMNANLDHAQIIPGVNTGRGTGIIDTLVFIPMVDAVGLLKPSGSWGGADEEALRLWFHDYALWLLSSKNGRDERASRNNHGSSYDAQVMAFSLFAGATDQARSIATGTTARRILKQINRKGELPEELARPHSFLYSLFGTQVLMDTATLAECVDTDLWSYGRLLNGSSIHNSLALLAPYAGKQLAWPYRDADKDTQHLLFSNVLREGAFAYADPTLRAADKRLFKRGDLPALAATPIGGRLSYLRGMQPQKR